MANNNRGRAHGLAAFLAAVVLAGLAWGETLDMVTYYPASGSAASVPQGPHVRSLTVGTDYAGEAPQDGDALIEGFVGIGTTSPQAALDVEGGVYFRGGSGDVNMDGYLNAFDAFTASAYLRDPAGPLRYWSYANADIDGNGVFSSTDLSAIVAQIRADPGGENVRVPPDSLSTLPPGILARRLLPQTLGVYSGAQSVGRVIVGEMGSWYDDVGGSPRRESTLARLEVVTANANDPGLRLIRAGDATGAGFLTINSTPGNTLLTTPNQNIILNPGTAFVGIGTAAPARLLQVNSPAAQASVGLTGASDAGQTFSALYLDDLTGDLNNSWVIGHRNRVGQTDQNNLLIGYWLNPATLRSILNLKPAGNVGIGTVNATGAASPGNGQATGNLDVNDVWLRAANGGAGAWMSPANPGSATGSYDGNNAAGPRAIGPLGFQPKIVMLYESAIPPVAGGTVTAVRKEASMPANMYRKGDLWETGTLTLTATGFSVGGNGTNRNSRRYYYWASR